MIVHGYFPQTHLVFLYGPNVLNVIAREERVYAFSTQIHFIFSKLLPLYSKLMISETKMAGQNPVKNIKATE